MTAVHVLASFDAGWMTGKQRNMWRPLQSMGRLSAVLKQGTPPWTRRQMPPRLCRRSQGLVLVALLCDAQCGGQLHARAPPEARPMQEMPDSSPGYTVCSKPLGKAHLRGFEPL